MAPTPPGHLRDGVSTRLGPRSRRIINNSCNHCCPPSTMVDTGLARPPRAAPARDRGNHPVAPYRPLPDPPCVAGADPAAYRIVDGCCNSCCPQCCARATPLFEPRRRSKRTVWTRISFTSSRIHNDRPILPVTPDVPNSGIQRVHRPPHFSVVGSWSSSGSPRRAHYRLGGMNNSGRATSSPSFPTRLNGASVC